MHQKICQIQSNAYFYDASSPIFQTSLEVATSAWGVQVERVEVKDVRVPQQLMRAMAAEAEAAREARAKVIAAEGEHKASKALMNAAQNIVKCPVALQVCSQQKFFFLRFSFFLSSDTCRHLGALPQKTTAPLSSPYLWTSSLNYQEEMV